ncbi:MAG TPA: hypothetical protein VF640_03760 [Acidimicrobiales bacterium]|jgi:hypothetical protein
MTPQGQRFAFRYGVWRWLLVAIGMGPRWSHVDLGPAGLEVRMGWAFRATVPRSSIAGVARRRDTWWGVGVHGGRGRWLVNGSVRGIVAVDVEPPVRARVIGVPVTLRTLLVSLDDPDAFLAAAG